MPIECIQQLQVPHAAELRRAARTAAEDACETEEGHRALTSQSIPGSGGRMATENMARTGEADETDRLISSEKVDGTTVYNRNGENIGSII